MPTKEITEKKELKETSIDSEEYEYVTIPPDGGFGWTIAFAAMVFLFLTLILSLSCLLI
jgi:hypothetical protein